MNYEQANGISIREGFLKFHRENPQVFDAFKKQVFRAISMGKKRISAKLIINWIRWNEYLETTDEHFKINDAYQSYYARLFVEMYPLHKDIFEFRTLRNEKNLINEFGQLEMF